MDVETKEICLRKLSVGMSGNLKGGDKFSNTWRKRYMPSLEKYSG